MRKEFFEINFNMQVKNTAMPLFHYHAQWELYYLLDGEREYQIDNKVFNLKNGTFIIIPPYVSHRTIGGSFKRILALIDDNMLNSDIKSKIAKTKSHFFVPSAEVLPLLQAQFGFLQEFWQSGKLELADVSIEINSILSKLLNNSYTIKQENITPILNKNAQIAYDIKQYVSANFGEKISVAEVAAICNLSESRASHIFKEIEGISITTYLNYVRLNKVQFLLVSSQKGLHEIAEECGFSSMMYLNQVFKRAFGITPIKYRRELCNKFEYN